MTAAAPSIDRARPAAADALLGWARRNGWTIGLLVFLALLFAFTARLNEGYGPAALNSLAIGVLPLALATVAQAIVVISGGIDLSVASMMALTAVVAASLMNGQPDTVSVGIVVAVLLLGLLLGLINGTLIVLTRVPDIVVTLAMSFVWAGCALLVLRTPGGAAAPWLRELTRGSFFIDVVPKAAMLLIVVVAVIWIPLQRSRIGLSFYAIGSNQLAAFRSGVSVGRTKVMAYAVTGLFAALGGLSLVATTGIGDPKPGPYTLPAVAAVVLGGVSLAGGRGGLVGPLIAVVILRLIRSDMTFLNLNTNLATVAEGVILIAVVMLGSFVQLRRNRA